MKPFVKLASDQYINLANVLTVVRLDSGNVDVWFVGAKESKHYEDDDAKIILSAVDYLSKAARL